MKVVCRKCRTVVGETVSSPGEVLLVTCAKCHKEEVDAQAHTRSNPHHSRRDESVLHWEGSRERPHTDGVHRTLRCPPCWQAEVRPPRQVVHQGGEEMSRNNHHRHPRSQGGTKNWPPGNYVRINARKHHLWHCLFENMTADAIMEYFNSKLIDPRFKLVKRWLLVLFSVWQIIKPRDYN